MIQCCSAIGISTQGEDVVAGIRTPEDIEVLKTCLPEAYKELVENCEILETHYKYMLVIFRVAIFYFIYFLFVILSDKIVFWIEGY